MTIGKTNQKTISIYIIFIIFFLPQGGAVPKAFAYV